LSEDGVSCAGISVLGTVEEEEEDGACNVACLNGELWTDEGCGEERDLANGIE